MKIYGVDTLELNIEISSYDFQLEEFLEQYGQQFPITVGFHEVQYNPETQEMSYTDTLGVKKTTSKEKAKEYRNRQERQGTLQTKPEKRQNKSDTTR